MDEQRLDELLVLAVNASIEAGKEILRVYGSEFAVEHKEDRSPLTLADRNAHNVIVSQLAGTGIPVLSEEGKEIPFGDRKAWKHLWIVDPLDGTKEFVKRNGEFTVNIALVEDGRPILGVIYVPVKEWLYFAHEGIGAYKNEGIIRDSALRDLKETAQKLPVDTERTMFTIVASRSHLSDDTKAYVEGLKKKHGEVELISTGSSIKLCLVAEGAADVYPRFAPTMEWDTAAGQAIAEAAGKQVLVYHSKTPVVYNRENLRNDWFIVQ